MVGGAAITFGLPLIFSTLHESGRSLYGQYYDINNTLSIFSMVLIGSLLPGVSRFAAIQSLSSDLLLSQARRVAFFLGIMLLLIFGVGGEFYAQERGHPHLSSAYLYGGLICCAYSFYAVHIGMLNGRKQFRQQAIFDAVFTCLKVTFVLGAATLGLGVSGAFAGFALAAISIAFLSSRSIKKVKKTGEPVMGFKAYTAWLVLYTLAFNLAFKVDALILRPKLAALLPNNVMSDALMGEYGIAVSLSRLPWQGTIALTFVIFPMISAATFRQDLEQAKRYIENTLRYALILICAVALPMSSRPDFIFDCIPGYSEGAAVLTYMAPAYICFSIANIHNTILMSSGRAKTALALMIITLGTIFLTFMLALSDIREASIVLMRAGQMTLVSFAFICLVGGLLIRKTFGCYLALSSLCRIILVMAFLIELSQLLTIDYLWMKLCVLGTLPFLFIGGLWLIRELNETDTQRFKRVFLNRMKAKTK